MEALLRNVGHHHDSEGSDHVIGFHLDWVGTRHKSVLVLVESLDDHFLRSEAVSCSSSFLLNSHDLRTLDGSSLLGSVDWSSLHCNWTGVRFKRGGVYLSSSPSSSSRW